MSKGILQECKPSFFQSPLVESARGTSFISYTPSTTSGDQVQELPANSFVGGGRTNFFEPPKHKKTDRQQTNKSQNFDKMKIGPPINANF
jgi:hypothetical protein